jgi:hypothetical protein
VVGSLVELFQSVSKKIIFVLRVYTICGMMVVYLEFFCNSAYIWEHIILFPMTVSALVCMW